MKKSRATLLSIILLFSLVMTACGSTKTSTESTSANTESKATQAETEATAEPIVFKLGHQAPAGTAYDILANTFKQYVEERSGGKYQIDIYNGGQLGGDRELMEALQAGNVAFNILTASDMGNFVPEMEVQDLPYLFEDWTQVEKFLDSQAAKDFYALSDSVGITTLSFMPRGFRHTTNNESPINTPADIAGKKLRVAESSIYIDTFEAFGANTLAMAWGEVFTALQQGTIDGHENTIVTIRDYKIDEVQKYISETYHMFGFAAITMNPGVLAEMSPEDQEMFRQAAIDAGKDAGQVQKEAEAAAKTELEGKGMEFNSVDIEAFKDLVQPVYDKYFETHDKAIFDSIKAAVQ
jgi:tripartite ATP-independent transporter DctP family solute receptor